MTTKHAEIDKDCKRKEFKALGIIVVLLFPVLSVLVVGGYGLIIWLIQAFGGVIAH